jgi:predicted transcriptional regulator
MTPIFKNAAINFEDIGEYLQNFHTEDNIRYQNGNKLIGLYFGKEILSCTPL